MATRSVGESQWCSGIRRSGTEEVDVGSDNASVYDSVWSKS